MKTTVVHHSADYDGLFCREIARKFLPDAELIGWNFGDPLVPFPEDGPVIVMDLPIDCLDATFVQDTYWNRLTWIDHHKSAIEKFQPPTFPPIAGYSIDGVAACRLAWQWFTWENKHPIPGTETCNDLPPKQDFIDRKVSEPLAVQLAGEYDIWDKRNPLAETFQYALRVQELSPHIWEGLLDPSINETLQVQESQIMVMSLMPSGHAAQSYARQENESLAKYRSFEMTWEGLRLLCLNTARCSSLTFEAAVKPEHDALMGFYWNGKAWTISLYHAPHRTDLDLSKIAVKYGGGGHRGACGMTCKSLPFPTP